MFFSVMHSYLEACNSKRKWPLFSYQQTPIQTFWNQFSLKKKAQGETFLMTKHCIAELSGRVLDQRPRGHGFEPHRCHCVVSLSKTN